MLKHARGLRDMLKKQSGEKKKFNPSCKILRQVLLFRTNSSFSICCKLYFDSENNLRHFNNSENKHSLDRVSCFTHETIASYTSSSLETIISSCDISCLTFSMFNVLKSSDLTTEIKFLSLNSDAACFNDSQPN